MKRRNPYSIMVCVLLVLVFSCTSCRSRLSGSWAFVRHFEGKAGLVDSLDRLGYRNGNQVDMLSFYRDHTFISMHLKGFYRKKGNDLKMKYDNDRDTIVLKIAYRDRQNLLLSSVAEKPVFWFYKRIKK